MNAAVKIYGERNTGTNYLQRLVALNFDAALLPGEAPADWLRQFGNGERSRDRYFELTFAQNLGWKHGMAPDPDALAYLDCCAAPGIVFLTLTKNPYSWLLSLFNRPYHAKTRRPGFEEFLALPWETVRRENAPEPFANPVALWNRKNAAYLELKRRWPTLNLRYEDLLREPFAVLERIAALPGMRKKRPQPVNVERSTKEHGKTFEYYRDYYLQERWRGKLTDASVALINARLDRELMRDFGYEMLP
ncbi:MAG: hypothetical protein HYU77_04185 [Betaproteobacteria bacterium]|nr:hypothetical protein [Betaproteobacteria bacterium]